MFGRTSIRWLIGLWLANQVASPAEPLATPPPLPRPFTTLILPEVKFRDADLMGALTYLRRKAEESSQGKVRIHFEMDLPPDFAPRYELTLALQSVPLAEALQYLGQQAGVEFTPLAGTVLVRPLGSAAAQANAPRKKDPSPAVSPPTGQSTPTPLSKPAETLASTHGTHRALNGVVQPDKSGYIPRRTLSGWSVESDPRNVTSTNCINPATCPTKSCGCYACTCQPPSPARPPP